MGEKEASQMGVDDAKKKLQEIYAIGGTRYMGDAEHWRLIRFHNARFLQVPCFARFPIRFLLGSVREMKTSFHAVVIILVFSLLLTMRSLVYECI